MKEYTFQCHIYYKPDSGLKSVWIAKTAGASDRVEARLIIDKNIKKNPHVEKVDYKFMY